MMLFTSGVLMSVGHCVGMCGPITIAFGVHAKRAPLTLSLFHAGRVSCYVALGAFAGWLGASATLAQGRAPAFLSLTLGLLMILVALGFLGVLPTRRWIEQSPWSRALMQRLMKAMGRLGPSRPFGLGFANGLLPCGPVYAIAIAVAATGQVTEAMLGMLLYGLGTVPVLLFLGCGVGALSVAWRRRLYAVGGLTLVLVSGQLILRGMASLGWVEHLQLGAVVIY